MTWKTFEIKQTERTSVQITRNGLSPAVQLYPKPRRDPWWYKVPEIALTCAVCLGCLLILGSVILGIVYATGGK